MTKEEDGPAVVRRNGDKWWYQYGKEHREDGSAIERADGSKQWYRDGMCHREDGPAYEGADGRKRPPQEKSALPTTIQIALELISYIQRESTG